MRNLIRSFGVSLVLTVAAASALAAPVGAYPSSDYATVEGGARWTVPGSGQCLSARFSAGGVSYSGRISGSITNGFGIVGCKVSFSNVRVNQSGTMTITARVGLIFAKTSTLSKSVWVNKPLGCCVSAGEIWFR